MVSIFDNKNALIIEDEASAIKVMQHLLEQVSVGVTIMLDHEMLTDQLKDLVDIPDVVFLDLEMPKSNGYRVLEYLQQDVRFAGVPIVAYTTHISHLNAAQNAGFHSFLGKPIDGDRFPEHLENILRGIPVWEVFP